MDYGYDELGRLTFVTDAANNITSYTYDDVGNRIEGVGAGVTTQYQYDDNDRLSQ